MKKSSHSCSCGRGRDYGRIRERICELAVTVISHMTIAIAAAYSSICVPRLLLLLFHFCDVAG